MNWNQTKQTYPTSPTIQITKEEGWKREEKFLGKLFEAGSLCILLFNDCKLKWGDLAFLR